MSSLYPPARSFFPGRWQPLHPGHVQLIREALEEDRRVLIGIMDTPQSERNPYTMAQRRHMFLSEFGPEIAEGRLELLEMPWVDEVCYGRNCGWRTRRIKLPKELEEISGTALRKEMVSNGEG